MTWSPTLILFLWVQVSCGNYLLPGDVVPQHYDLAFTYDIDPRTNFSFYGVADIMVTVKKTTSKIVLHAQDFSIPDGRVTISGLMDPRVSEVKLNDTFNLLTIALDKDLTEGSNYTLTIPFFGNLKQGLDGVYISTYIEKNTQSKEYLIATQFEATSARKGFPCFDEPIYKATFKVAIGHNKEFTAVANMPLMVASNENAIEQHWPWMLMSQTFNKEKSQFVWDHFDVSVPMSTYLMAYVVSKFSYVESPADLSHTKFKVWARSDAADQTAYAANIGPRVLTHFENWFNVSFPLPKQDMIAIPDFAAGAMENWGLITYRETALLYDKEQSSFLNKERVAEVVAHELAHQWFGNLVTMKWWSDLWLNEGFATFAASVGVAAVEPTWHALDAYAVDNVLAVLALDALEASHPVSVPIDNPKRISEIFDEISYKKGAALIRMMTMFLGDDVFRKAINRYLVKYSYRNAEQDDLWRELTSTSQRDGGVVLPRNLTVKHVMDTWTTQTGYPLLTVTRDYEDQAAVVTQRRYLSLGARASSQTGWWVPLRVLSARDPAVTSQAQPPLQWLGDTDGLYADHRFRHDAQPQDWLLFNADMIAPYRVNYDQRNWQLLTNVLLSDKFQQVPALGRVQLLSDAFALAATNRLDYTTTLKLASYLQRESDYLPLSTALKGLSKIETVLKRTPDYGAFQKYMRKLIRAPYERSGGLAAGKILNGDDLNSVKTQVLTSGWACRMKVPGCEENAVQLFNQWMETDKPDENNPIPLDLRRTVYCVGVSRGSVRHWRFLLARKQRTNVAAARALLLHALTCTREVWILNQYLEWTVSDNSEVRRQDAASVIVNIASSSVGYYVAKEFFYTRIEDIYSAFNEQGRRLGYIVKTLLDQFTSQRELDEFMEWKSNNSKYLEDAKLSVEQAIERAKVNIDWIEKNKKLVVEKMREFST